jgi:hypothetical protein
MISKKRGIGFRFANDICPGFPGLSRANWPAWAGRRQVSVERAGYRPALRTEASNGAEQSIGLRASTKIGPAPEARVLAG